MIENTILKRNRAGKGALILGLTFPAPAFVEFASAHGFDAVNGFTLNLAIRLKPVAAAVRQTLGVAV